ncbi:hypothetical protein MMA231_03458 (plasmid) [Asticcacaulis sp. MM231]
MNPNLNFIDFDRAPKSHLNNGYVVEPTEIIPSIRILEDVFIIPGYDALYTVAGDRIYGTRRSFVPNDLQFAVRTLEKFNASYAAHAPEHVDIPKNYDIREDTTYYGGIAWTHYGHFIMDGMSRFWALDLFPSDMPIIYTDYRAPNYIKQPYIGPVLRSLNIAERMFSPNTPVLLKKVIVPTASIQNVHRIFNVHSKSHVQAAQAMLADNSPKFKGRKVYLSRSRLAPGLRHSEQEALLEQKLSAKGFSIVYPETLSLQKQVDIFNHADVIAGTCGSAFHTSLFTQNHFTGKIIILSWEKINFRYLMVNSIKKYSITYINSCKIEGVHENSRISSLNIDYNKSYEMIMQTIT